MTRTYALIVFAVLAMWAVPLYLNWRIGVWFLAGWMLTTGVREYYARREYAKRIAELKARARR